jgi:hypothetical protein
MRSIRRRASRAVGPLVFVTIHKAARLSGLGPRPRPAIGDTRFQAKFKQIDVRLRARSVPRVEAQELLVSYLRMQQRPDCRRAMLFESNRSRWPISHHP